jgi:hypothetical protein
MRTAPEIPWQLLNVTLIDPVAAGFMELRGSAAQQQDYLQQLDNSLMSYSVSLANSVDQV